MIITVVSGLPRSGTSLVMQMLAAGGLPVLTDAVRAADEDNLRGYYEFEPVRRLADDCSWLPMARGRAVKVISALLRYLPEGERYRLIMVSRAMGEVLASQRAMLLRRGKHAAVEDARMAQSFEAHLRRVDAWLATRPDIAVLRLDYHAIVADPAAAAGAIQRFLGPELDAARMAGAVDPALHRQRRG